MTPEQQHHICTELARRMGWTTCSGGWIARDDRILPDAPDPFTNAEDNRALVAWLAAGDDRWNRFTDQLYIEWNKVRLDNNRNVKPNTIEWERFTLTASCETITLCAYIAVTGDRTYGI